MAQKKKEEYLKFYCNLSGKQEPRVPDVHLPYDVPVYKSKVVHRGLLKPEQHIDLLATPKGFRWNKDTGTFFPFKWSLDDLICYKKKPLVKENDVPLIRTDQRYIKVFLTEIWNYLTPELLEELKDILVREIGMSKKQAEVFVEEQRTRSTFRETAAFSRSMLSVRHGWVREMADSLAGKAKNHLQMMMSAERTKRMRHLSTTVCKKLGELTGEKQDDTPLQEVMKNLSDRIGVWLGDLLSEEVETKVCREEALKELGLEPHPPEPGQPQPLPAQPASGQPQPLPTTQLATGPPQPPLPSAAGQPQPPQPTTVQPQPPPNPPQI